jgi:lysophospholipase L1-like esterase
LQEFLKNAALVTFGVLVAAGAGELFLRATHFGEITPQMSFGPQAKQALEQGYFATDPTLFWKAHPNRRPDFQRKAKMVHPDRPIPPKDTRQRLVILGDSCSRLVVSGLPYSAALQAELAPDGWEVLNASVPGYSSYQGLLWLQSQILAAEPDVVAVYFGWNDHWRTPGRTDRQYEQSIQPGQLRLLNLLSRKPKPPPFRVPRDEYRENLQAMIEAVSDAGGQTLLITAPYRFAKTNQKRYVKDAYLLPDDDAFEIHQSYLDIVREFEGREDVSILAVDLVFDALGESPPLLRRDGIHFTNSGQAAMAALIAEQIRSGAGSEGTAAPALVEAARRVLAERMPSDESRRPAKTD